MLPTAQLLIMMTKSSVGEFLGCRTFIGRYESRDQWDSKTKGTNLRIHFLKKDNHQLCLNLKRVFTTPVTITH